MTGLVLRLDKVAKRPRAAAVDRSSWAAGFTTGMLARIGLRGDLAACLPALLVALDWRGSPRLLAEILPAGNEPVDLTDLDTVLRRAGFDVTISNPALFNSGEEPGPWLVLPRRGMAYLVLGREPQGFLVYRPSGGGLGVEEHIERGVRLLGVRPLPETDEGNQAAAGGWVVQARAVCLPVLAAAGGLTAMANLMGLAGSFFVMAVYDRVIAAHAPWVLPHLLLGAVLALAFELAARDLRGRLLSRGGARLGFLVGNQVFARLLTLPAQLTERASLSSQLARIRDLDRVRDLLMGPLAQVLLDLPFVLIFIIALAVIGGWLALVPLVASLAMAGIACLSLGPDAQEAGRRSGQRQELLLEVIDKMAAIRRCAATRVWAERFSVVSEQAIEAVARSALTAASIQALSHMGTMLTGIATISVGIGLVLDGSLTTGGLIAATMLTWRVLGPVQGGIVALGRVRQLIGSLRQVGAFLAMPAERAEGKIARRLTRVDGRITFSHVTFRYGRETEPILGNLNFEIEPGECVALTGSNGVGKSTMMKLFLGLYQAQIGRIRIDGKDIRQYDPIELRHVIGYVPQTPHLFPGTLAENIRMGAPLATEQEIQAALRKAAVDAEIAALPDGINTQLDAVRLELLPTTLKVRIAIARALARKPRILLLDDATALLDGAREELLLTMLQGLRGSVTVIMISHRPSQIRRADKLLLLGPGGIKFFGRPTEIDEHLLLESI